MAKSCMYCGQLLARDDAQFCASCGQLQGSPATTAGEASASAIKVKLPPKEVLRSEPPASWQERTALPGTGTSQPPLRERPAAPVSHRPKRPVRLTSAAVSSQRENDAAPLLPPDDAPRAEVTLAAAPPEESTMVLPGWQEEIAQLRREQGGVAQADLPTTKMDAPTPGVAQADLPTTKMDAPTPAVGMVQPGMRKDTPSLAPMRPTVASAPLPNPPTPLPALPDAPLRQSAEPSVPARTGEASAELARRELRVKVWEEEATMQFPQVAPEGSPAPALEQIPVAQLDFEEDQPSPLAELETLHWQTVPRPEKQERPVPTPEQQPVHPGTSMSEPEVPLAQIPAAAVPATPIEDLPTKPIEVPPVQLRPGIVVERSSTPAPTKLAGAPSEAVEDRPTLPMVASSATRQPQVAPPSPPPPFAGAVNQAQTSTKPASVGPANPFPNTHYGAMPDQQTVGGSAGAAARTIAPPEAWGLGPRPGTPGPANTPLPAGPRTPLPPTSANSGEREAPTATVVSPEHQAEPAPVEKSRRTLPVGRMLVAIFAIALLVGGVLYYVIDQPFTNQLATQISQSYQSTSLGVTLNYPDGWKSSIQAGVVLFTDSSQTGQVELSAANVGSAQTLATYMSSEEKQLGITGTKSLPAVSFAGTTWTAVQGSVIEEGATYTITLYVTQHNGRFYALACLAPSQVYAQMEQDSFAPLRQTFSFL